MSSNYLIIFLVCIAVAIVFYFVVYVIIPLLCLFIFIATHYKALVVENGCYGVKINKSDPTFHYYTIDVKKMKLYDIYWEMYEVHKRAYTEILKQIKNGESNEGTNH